MNDISHYFTIFHFFYENNKNMYKFVILNLG